MRAEDREECRALGRSPKDALRTGLRASLEAYTALDGKRPIAMLGVVPTALMGGSGTVWMLGTDDVFRFGRVLLSIGPAIIAHWLDTFDRLENVVSAENHKAIRLLRRWQFQISDERRTIGGVDFLPFSIERAAIQERSLAA